MLFHLYEFYKWDTSGSIMGLRGEECEATPLDPPDVGSVASVH